MLKKIQEMDIVTKMSIVGALVILFVIMTFVIVSCDKSKAPVVVNPGTTGIDTPEDVVDETPKELTEMTGVISNVDSDSNKLWVTDIKTYEKRIIIVPATLTIMDAFGSSISLNQLDIGQLIECKYDQNTMTADKLNVYNGGFEKDGVKNLVIDEENKTITINNDTYFYNEDLILYFGDEAISLSEIDPVDEVVVRGYLDTIWSITLKNKHGYVSFTGTASFIGATVEISKTYSTIASDTRLTVPVGVHDVIVTKDGFPPYVTRVTIEEDKEVVIDLSSVQTELGAVKFTIVQSGSTLYVDDTKITDVSNPVELSYGTHSIRVENSGYLTLQSVLDVTQAYLEYKIDFEDQNLMVSVTGPLQTDLYIDDVFIGTIPIQVPISEGTHTFKLEKEGYFPKTQDVSINIESGVYEIAFPELIVNPNYSQGELTISIDNPVGCELYIGTELIGTIPVSTQVVPAQYQLTIRKDGYYTKLYTISVIAGGEPFQYTFPELIPIDSGTDTPTDGTTDGSTDGSTDGNVGADVY